VINLGIIGLGNAGAHHAATQAANPLARIAAVSEVDASLLETVGSKYPRAQRYADWRDLIDDKNVDAVILATPPAYRREMFVAAAGKAILAEKPFGVTLDDAREMAAAAEKHGVRAMVNFGTRNLPTYQTLRKLVLSGDYGVPRWIWFKYFLISNPKVFAAPGWFWNKEISGGHIAENAGHAFDLICELMGPVEKVTGTTAFLPLDYFGDNNGGRTPTIENLGIATLKHANGGVTALANGSVPGGFWGMSFEIVTENCVIAVSRDRNIEIQRDGEKIFQHASPVGWSPIPHGSLAFVRYIAGCSEPDDSIASCGDGVRAMQIAHAFYQSAAAEQTVKFSEV
jgi:predicted dehydrogenase